ncbi:hypothetical protein [Flavobacterium sp.]|uniref:hypothetical protein n=1 Tax=Flavobacterium sp. TaxID=239 RepID=UPI002FD9483D
MTSSDNLAIFASVISIIALLIPFLSFRRERNKSNQDFIFQEKVLAYKDLIFQASQTYEQLFFLVEELQEFEGTKEEWEVAHGEECGRYYSLGYDFQKVIFRNIPILPNNIYKEMDSFSHEAIHFVTSAFNCNSNLTTTAYDNLEISLEKIIELVRIDLKVEKLNLNLAKRLD